MKTQTKYLNIKLRSKIILQLFHSLLILKLHYKSLLLFNSNYFFIFVHLINSLIIVKVDKWTKNTNNKHLRKVKLLQYLKRT